MVWIDAGAACGWNVLEDTIRIHKPECRMKRLSSSAQEQGGARTSRPGGGASAEAALRVCQQSRRRR